ncbi:hypothetical protein EDC94DRAFT_689882 [Helicostylum pulchrum]|uniref:Myb-like domain-containing protein n=1 Tax=Helicostylum pulchrum TaxID=562976 RepID=A0ABP9XV48_9FUNG|nr:hypothetical protein EDC94DRAFT_689882 [Helicostylum pulchrum]
MNCKSFRSVFNFAFTQQRTLSTANFPQKIWSVEETKKLLRLIDIHGNNWVLLQSHFPDRGSKSLGSRYRLLKSKSAEELKALLEDKKPEVPKIKNFSKTEDRLLDNLVHSVGLDWDQICLEFPGRTKVELSERYEVLAVEPSNRRGPWSAKESKHFESLFAIYGDDFSRISAALKTRSIKQCQIRHSYFSSLRSSTSTLKNEQIEALKKAVEDHGPEDFKLVLQKAKLPYSLIVEDVRKYYWRELDPKIVVGEWQDYEVEFMVRLYDELDGCMELVQARMPIKRGLKDMWIQHYKYIERKSLL